MFFFLLRLQHNNKQVKMSKAILGLVFAFSLSTATLISQSIRILAPDHSIEVSRNGNTNYSFHIEGNVSEVSNVFLRFTDDPEAIVSHQNIVRLPEEGDRVPLVIKGLLPGQALINTSVHSNPSNVSIDLQNAFIFVSVYNSEALTILSDIVGWLYFFAWSVSFYPQIYENWKRKSVIGLNFDFLSLNIVGFFLYSLFNIGLYAIPSIQNDYFIDHPEGVNPVKLNDVIFSVHAALACALTIFQCTIYERRDQSISRTCIVIQAGIAVLIGTTLLISIAGVIIWLDFLYICSYVKLFITLVKYVPQAYMNYSRKSTCGWSIGNVLLDFSGGTLSIAQMFIIAYNFDDWSSIFGDPTKFGLGLFSVLFDVFFMLQHYVFYRNRSPYEEVVNNQEVVGEAEEIPELLLHAE